MKRYWPAVEISNDDLGSQEFLQWLLETPTHMKFVPHAYTQYECMGNSESWDVAEECRRIRSMFLNSSMLLAAYNSILLEKFREVGLPAIPLKGPVLATRIYGGLHHRPFSDLDILVKNNELELAKKVVVDCGFEECTRNPRHFHLEFVKKTESGTSIYLDLHRRLIGYALGGDHLAFGLSGSAGLSEWCWDRAKLVSGSWQMNSTDEFLFLCLHLTKHILMERSASASGFVCNSLLLARDIHLAITVWEDDLDWVEFSDTVARFHLRRPVSIALAFVAYWFSCSEPGIEEYVQNVTDHQKERYFSWSKVRNQQRSSLVEVNARVKLIVESFLMADCWSDRIKIPPLILKELASRLAGKLTSQD